MYTDARRQQDRAAAHRSVQPAYRMSASEQPIPAKPRLSWRGVSMLMVSDIVGTSVLTFPAVAAELGYALTVLLIVGLFPVTVYVSVLMARTHVRVRGIDSLGSAARRIFGPRYAGGTFVVVYGYTLLGNASYLLVLGTSLQGVFYDARLCLAAASGLGALLLAPLVVGLRRLGDSVVLCSSNLLTCPGHVHDMSETCPCRSPSASSTCCSCCSASGSRLASSPREDGRLASRRMRWRRRWRLAPAGGGG